ncbi:MAG TPA: DUF6172 family protein [Ramlibacter sp.]|nr:DUF6172 family protein [Ramlibacter sp.]
MRKTFQLAVEGKNRDRVVDAVKHEIRKYVKRERRRELPAGVDFLDFDCRFGLAPDSAQAVHLNGLIPAIDAAVKEGATSCYVEILAKPGHRKARPAGSGPDADASEGPAATDL